MKKPQTKPKTISRPAVKQTVQKHSGSNKALPWLIIAALVAFSFVVFLPMLSNEFTEWDDTDYVTKNLSIINMDAAKVQYIFTHPIAYNYHPLAIISLG